MTAVARFFALSVSLCLTPALFAGDFGFDEAEDGAGQPRSLLPFTLDIGGEIDAGPLLYVHDFKDRDRAGPYPALDSVSAILNFTASGTSAEAFVALNFSSAAAGELWSRSPDLGEPGHVPLILDEAWVRGYLGKASLEAGLLKINWGRMHSPGPLDVVNPVDYSDLTDITDFRANKIARPMARVTWNIGDFTALEAVFVPSFTGDRYDRGGRWTPSRFADMYDVAGNGIRARALEKNPALGPYLAALYPAVEANLLNHFAANPIAGADTSGLRFFQAGLRFTTTAGPADFGAQYYYGNLFRPVFSIGGVDNFLTDLAANNYPPNVSDPYPGDATLLEPKIEHNRYHQIGVDYAQVIAGFNLRAEFAAHITEDHSGGDGAVRNPFLAWSFGFDRDILWGVNVNIQCNETVRLLSGRIGGNPALDCEAGTEAAATRLIAQVSKTFFQDRLECKVVNIWDIEDRDCYVIPSLAWTLNDVIAGLSAGIFAGREAGELGQYWDNSFIRLGVKYLF